MWNWLKRIIHFAQVDELASDEFEQKIRNAKEVAERAIALYAIIGKVHQNQNPEYHKWLKAENITDLLTESEKAFISEDNPEKNLNVQFSWQAEGLCAILWALGIIKKMPNLNVQFDVFSIERLGEIIDKPHAFISSANLLDENILRDKAEDLYHQHWRVRDAQLHRTEIPKELDPGIVYERRYALSWIIGDGDDWDNVPADT